MLTVVLGFVLDGILDERNADTLKGWFGEDIYAVIMAYLTENVEMPTYRDMDYINTEAGAIISPVNNDKTNYGALYNEVYTKEMGAYIEKWLPTFVDTLIALIGVEKVENGPVYEDLSDILTTLVDGTIYKMENIEAIADLIVGLIADLEEQLGEKSFEALANVINAIIGTDVTYWKNYKVTNFPDGDRTMFVKELTRVLDPITPILAWLLTGEELVSLFNTGSGDEALVIAGAKGYSYGIIPLLEAFDYDSEKILTPAEYEAAYAEDSTALLSNIINPILDVVDAVLADPVNEIFNVLPGLLYFINSDGLQVFVENTASAALAVLKNISAITGIEDVNDVYGLIGLPEVFFVNGELTIDIDTIIRYFLADLEAANGVKFADLAINAVVELTAGEVVEYESKNGSTAYTMVYAGKENRADMVTIVLRAALDFIAIPENAATLMAMVDEANMTDDAKKFVTALLENFAEMAADEDGIYEIMYTVYQVFYAANNAVYDANGAVDKFNGDYTFLNSMFKDSKLTFMNQLQISFGDLLNKYTGDIIDDTEIAPNGFVRFFQQIADFFKRIGDWFKNLFS